MRIITMTMINHVVVVHDKTIQHEMVDHSDEVRVLYVYNADIRVRDKRSNQIVLSANTRDKRSHPLVVPSTQTENAKITVNPHHIMVNVKKRKAKTITTMIIIECKPRMSVPFVFECNKSKLIVITS